MYTNYVNVYNCVRVLCIRILFLSAAFFKNAFACRNEEWEEVVEIRKCESDVKNISQMIHLVRVGFTRTGGEWVFFAIPTFMYSYVHEPSFKLAWTSFEHVSGCDEAT